MFDYIAKFSKLPQEVRERISNPVVSARVEAMEEKHGVSLAKTIMRVATKDLGLEYIGLTLMKEYGLDGARADALAQDLYKNVFYLIADWLGIPAEAAGELNVKSEKLKVVENSNFSTFNIQHSTFNNKINDKTQISDKDQDKNEHDDLLIPELLGTPVPIKIARKDLEEEEKIVGHKIPEPRLMASKITAPKDVELKVEFKAPPKYVRTPVYSANSSSILNSNAIRQNSEQTNNVLTEIKTLDSSAIETIADQAVISASGMFSSSGQKERARAVLKSYLKGIRMRLEAKLALGKSFETGGAGMDEQNCDELLKMADEAKKNPPARKVDALRALDKIINEGARDIPYDIKSAIKEREEEDKLKAESNKLKVEREITKSQSVETPGTIKVSISSDGITGVRKNVEQAENPEPAPDAISAKIRVQTDSGRKKRMDDVMFTPKVMGPIDELRYMDLVTFRRLNPDPVKATVKIKEKIELLGQDQYAKRIEGIKAWRLSPVNKLYSMIGNESITGGKSVEKIIEDLRLKGAEYLAAKEFDAIMDLNKGLRF
jgi:hypothetical protein